MSRSQKKKHRARLRREFTLSNRLKQRLEEGEERRQFYYVRERETPVNHVKAEQGMFKQLKFLSYAVVHR